VSVICDEVVMCFNQVPGEADRVSLLTDLLADDLHQLSADVSLQTLAQTCPVSVYYYYYYYTTTYVIFYVLLLFTMSIYMKILRAASFLCQE